MPYEGINQKKSEIFETTVAGKFSLAVIRISFMVSFNKQMCTVYYQISGSLEVSFDLCLHWASVVHE